MMLSSPFSFFLSLIRSTRFKNQRQDRGVCTMQRVSETERERMGKRKSSPSSSSSSSWAKKLQPKKLKMEKLDTVVFKCPFCENMNSVECRIETKVMIGVAECWACEERYCTPATALTELIDIYHEWLDEYQRANQENLNF